MEQNNKELLPNEVRWVSSQNPNNFALSLNENDRKESISFWNEAPLFPSSVDLMNELDPINKFVIEKIEIVSPEKKILFGHLQSVVVEGIFAETAFTVGQRVAILPCLCCIQDKKLNADCTNENCLNSTIQKDKPTAEALDKGIHKKFKSFTSLNTENSNFHITFHVSDNSNTILIEDDILTVTSFCKALECINNPLINSMVADFSFDYGHRSLVVGIIIHELIQSSFINRNKAFDFLTLEAKRIIRENLVLLYSCNISDKEALNEVLKNMQNIMKLIKGDFDIRAVEHKVFSSFFGLKGSIDCLDSKYVIEIKTGKYMNNQHRSQAILYTLLIMEQNLRKNFDNYGQFLCDVSILNEEADTHPIEGKNKNTQTILNELYNNYSQILNPLLYYVQKGDFTKITLNHEEIIFLLKTRNDITCTKSIKTCECPENFVCSILNRIKSLNDNHFLKRQYDGIELEANREKKFVRCSKVSQNKNRIVYKTKDSISIGEYVHIYTANLKYVAVGIVENYENNVITIDLHDIIDTDRIIMICFDNDTNSLKFMRWALVHIAYLQYLKKDTKGAGIDSFLLPGQKYGLEIEEDCLSCLSLDEIEQCDIDSSLGVNELDKKLENSTGENVNYESKSRSNNQISTCFSANENTNKKISTTKQSFDICESSELSYSQIFSDDITTELSKIENIDGYDGIFNSDFSDETTLDNLNSMKENELNVKQEAHFTKNNNKNYQPTSKSYNINCSENAAHSSTRLNNKIIPFNDLSNSNTFPSCSPQNVNSSIDMPKPRVLFNNFDVIDTFPYFTPSLKSSSQNYKYCIPEMYKNEFLKLNEDQRRALFSALNCENYQIIHGMPGTGKSTLIALLIKILIFYKHKVLLVCYTHLAIQNILDKVGSVNYYRAKKESLNFEKYEDCVRAFKNPDLVAGTCYSFNDPIYLNKKFDYCIIDEGSQIHLLLSLIPIHISQRFCIVGDHLQLKPLCKKAQVLSLSLFEYLMDKCSTLTHQYRMGDKIMNLSNTMFYDNKLVGFGGSSSVIFVDSENLNFSDYIKHLKNIVVLCYFNSKVREIQILNKELIVTTIDRYQGSEADEVIVIFDPVEQCSVIESNERLNVALTRARKKLILFGNKREMLLIPLFKKLLSLI